MRNYIKFTVIWLSIISYLLVLSSSTALAAAATTAQNPVSNGQALEIAPPLVYLNVDPGQSVTTQILIRDISSGNLIVTGQVNDFVAAGENGTPKILLNNNTYDPYSLKSWVASLPSLLLTPKQIKTLNVTLNVPSNASPGGHYGVVRFTATPPSLEGTSGVSLATSLGALLLVTVSGKITENVTVQSFSVNNGGKSQSLFESGPVNFVEQFHNLGNVQEQPTGQVSITDMFGTKLADVNVNLPPGNILPQSIRQFSEPLNSSVIGNKRLLGRYTAALKVTYGASHKVLTASIVFWVIPFKLIGVIIIILVAAFFILRYFIRRYNRHILSKSGKTSRRK